MIAGAIQVLALMWLRTITNYQVSNIRKAMECGRDRAAAHLLHHTSHTYSIVMALHSNNQLASYTNKEAYVDCMKGLALL